MAVFNKLRLKYLFQDKFRNYFLYALGEIVLIVFGILIALQINNWNEGRKTEHKATEILSGILKDLDTDYFSLQSVIAYQHQKQRWLESIIEHSANANMETKRIIDALYTRTQKPNLTFFPHKGAYRSAANSGSIESIDKAELMHAITSLYEHYYQRLVYNGEIYDSRVDRIVWERRKYFDLRGQRINSLEDVRSRNFTADAEYLLSRNRAYLARAEETLQQLHKVREIIQNELDRYNNEND